MAEIYDQHGKMYDDTGNKCTYLSWESAQKGLFLYGQYLGKSMIRNKISTDTLFNQKFYVIFIISHKTREIVLSALTQHPTKEFVKQQIAELERNTTIGNLVYLIRDRGPQFFINYTNSLLSHRTAV
jgi:hypothetical protein